MGKEYTEIDDTVRYGRGTVQEPKDAGFANYFDNQTEEQILAYRRERNARSLDGLHGLDR